MEPNELRIGNYFHPMGYTQHGALIPHTAIIYRCGAISPFNIEAIELERPETLYFKLSEISPVKLTIDILKKCGLEPSNERQGEYFIKDLVCISFITKDDTYQLEYKIAGIEQWIVLDVTYLHQLQNLIFALTGKELNVNLSPRRKAK